MSGENQLVIQTGRIFDRLLQFINQLCLILHPQPIQRFPRYERLKLKIMARSPILLKLLSELV